MILAIYGMFALGKSYFVRERKDAWSDIVRPDLNVVVADQQEEYHFEKDENLWIFVRGPKARWKGRQTDKKPFLSPMIEDHDTLWIIESARFFGGLQHDLVSAFKASGGGLKFIVPITDIATGKQFLIDRCEKGGKSFREEYWTEQRLRYETKDRYVNPMQTYIAAGMDCLTFHIDYERRNWDQVDEQITRWLKAKEDKWYNWPTAKETAERLKRGKHHEDSSGEGQQRIGQVYHRTPVVRP